MNRILSLALAVALAACAGGGAATTTTTTGAEPPPTTGTTAPAPTPTTSAPTTTTTTAEEAVGVSAYFLHETGGNRARFGPFVLPVHRQVAPDGEDEAALVATAVEELLAGPSEEEAGEGITSAVPEGSSLLGVTVDGGIATVDLSAEFASGGGTTAVLSRLAQLVFTATGVEGVDAVVVSLEGEAVHVFSGEGVVIEEPQARAHYEDFTPGILVDEPAWGAPVADPIQVSGVAAAFEGVFQLEVQDAEGTAIAGPPFVQTDEGMGWGDFALSVDLPDDAPEDLVLHVWEASAEDGSPVSERFIPIRLEG